MSTTRPPEDTAADGDPDDPVPPTGRIAPGGGRTARRHALIGADLVMVLVMVSVVGLLFGVVALVEFLT